MGAGPLSQQPAHEPESAGVDVGTCSSLQQASQQELTGSAGAQHEGMACMPKHDATARHWQQHMAIHIASRCTVTRRTEGV